MRYITVISLSFARGSNKKKECSSNNWLILTRIQPILKCYVNFPEDNSLSNLESGDYLKEYYLNSL